MPFTAQVLTVLLASPRDTAMARRVVERTIADWNGSRSRDGYVLLRSRWWETDAVPVIGVDGQSVINRQLVDQADVVVALFHTRLGAPTARAASGTAEEIDRAVDRGIPVHVYFGEMPYPYGANPVELERLRTFRLSLQERGLVGTYASNHELAGKVRTALEHDVAKLAPRLGPPGLKDGGRSWRSPETTPTVVHASEQSSDRHANGPGAVQQTVGRNLRAYRLAAEANQEAFATLMGVHRTYLANIERGTRNLTLGSVERLAASIGVTPFELLRDRPDSDR